MNEEKKTFISGIYNYCDRWCEKCSFASNCLLFSNESKIATFEILNDRLPEADEIMDEIFEADQEDDEQEFDWNDYSLEDEDEEENFSLEDVKEDDEENEPKHLIEELADDYLKRSQILIKNLDEKFNFSSTPKENLTMPQVKKIFDDFESIAWYHAFIFVKIKRALSGKRDFIKEKDEESKEFSKYDMDGTAKVAAISIKNSIKALSDLNEYLPEYASEIIKLSFLLNKIFIELEKEFPDYDKFKRPGFDD